MLLTMNTKSFSPRPNKDAVDLQRKDALRSDAGELLPKFHSCGS